MLLNYTIRASLRHPIQC